MADRGPEREEGSVSVPQGSRLSLVTGRLATCPTCRDLGWVRNPEAEQIGRLELCPDCGQGRRVEAVTKRCGLEPSELELRLTDWKPGPWQDLRRQRADALVTMCEVIEARQGFVTFWGDYGAGKTLALQTVTNELRLRGVGCHYVPFSVLAGNLRDAMFNSDRRGAVEQYWEWIVGIDALAVDEVTRFNPTGWARERLWMLADTRYRRREEVLTIMATNEDPTVPLPTTEAVGYLYSRMRQGRLVELRGDMRTAARWRIPDAQQVCTRTQPVADIQSQADSSGRF